MSCISCTQPCACIHSLILPSLTLNCRSHPRVMINTPMERGKSGKNIIPTREQCCRLAAPNQIWRLPKEHLERNALSIAWRVRVRCRARRCLWPCTDFLFSGDLTGPGHHWNVAGVEHRLATNVGVTANCFSR